MTHLLSNFPQGFRLDFEFEENEYFTNQILSKSYFLAESPDTTEMVYDHAQGYVLLFNLLIPLVVPILIGKKARTCLFASKSRNNATRPPTRLVP